MYFPNVPIPSQIYPQQQPPNIPQSNIFPAQFSLPQTPPGSLFTYPTVIQPYTDRQFLCHTFNFKVPYIEAFLSLSHEEKLKFFLIIEKRRLTGELTEKDSYDKLLHKILLIVNPNYQKPQQQFQEISEEELKKKIIEKEFEQKCDWELRKLGMGEKEEDNSDLWKNYAVQGLGNYTIEGLTSNPQQPNTPNTQNPHPQPQDQQQFIYQQPQPLQHCNSSVMSPRKQSSTKKPEQQQEEEWQQAQQVNPLDQSSKLSIGKYEKVESIWDLELNEEQVKKVEPNIREIFGGKRDGQEDQFGGFEEAKQIDLGMNDYPKPTMTSMNENNHDFNRINDQLSQEQFPPSIEQFTPYSQPFTRSNDHFTPYNQQNPINPHLNNDWLLSGSQIQPHTNLLNSMTQNNPQQKPSSQPLFSFDTPQVSNPPSSLPVLQLDFLSLSQAYQAQGTVQKDQSNDMGFEFDAINDGNGPEVYQQSNVKQEQDQFVEAEFVEASYHEPNQMNFKENHEKIPSFQDNRDQFGWNTQISQVKQTFQDSHPKDQPNLSSIVNQDNDLTDNKNVDNQWTFTDTKDSHQTNDRNINSLSRTQQPTLSITKTNPSSVDYTFQSSFLSNDDPFSSIQAVQTPVINPSLTSEPLSTTNHPSTTFQAQFPPQPAIQPTNYITNSSQLYANIQQKPETFLQNKSTVSQVKSPLQIRPIRKIAKPPTVKYEEEFVKQSEKDEVIRDNKSSVQASKNGSLVKQGFNSKNNTEIGSTLPQPSLSQVIQPKNVYPTQIPRPTPPKSLSIVTQMNQPYQPTVLPPSQCLSQSSYIPTQPKQKIISTYNRNFLYSPRFQERKRQTFPAKKLLSEEEQKQRSINEIEQHSMVDGMLGRGSLGSPVFGRLKKPASNEQIDYSVDVQGRKNNQVRQVQDVDDEQILDQSQESSQRRPQHMHKRTATSPHLQPSYNFSKKTPPTVADTDPQNTSQPATNLTQHFKTLLTAHSQQLTYQLPQQVTTYLLTQTSSNKFCFDKDFYLRLGKILEFLSMEREMAALRQQFGLGEGMSVNGHLFCAEVEFLAEILKKLERIDELNKQFTVAMEEDQEEQLAQVVMKSKQLTFQVNEDAQEAKRIAQLILRYRSNHSTKYIVQAQGNQQSKYQGIYRILINLLIPTPQPTSPQSPSSLSPSSILLPLLSHLLTLLSPTSSTLSSNIPFLTSFTLLYLLHCHLNQLQYIQNISRAVFGYLIKQHSVLMEKINKIKEMSQKYAEAPQVIFGKLMEAPKMVDFLRGLGQMANCAERILRLIKLLGIKLDLPQENTSNQNRQKYSHQSIQKTITECRQLAIKYNLTSSQQPNLKQYQHYILTILSTSLTNQSSPWITNNKIQQLLTQKPICKICMTPMGNQSHGQTGEFLSNSSVRSQTQLGREDRSQVEWCHFVCYNMLKVAFQEANLSEEDFQRV